MTLKAMRKSVFNEIYQYFPKRNPHSTHKDDVSAIGTAPWELFYHALYLYVLDSWGIEGDVMECGTFKPEFPYYCNEVGGVTPNLA